MSVLLLTVMVLLVGAVTYRLFNRLVIPVRVFAVCLLTVILAAFLLQSREIFAHPVKSSNAFGSPAFSDKRVPSVPNPADDPEFVASFRFQSISREDQDFLDEILQNQNRDDQKQAKRRRTRVRAVDKTGIIGSSDESVLKGELVVNSAGGKRSEPITHKEAIKRAQLGAQNEMLKTRSATSIKATVMTAEKTAHGRKLGARSDALSSETPD